jgi:hypothetical protein
MQIYNFTVSFVGLKNYSLNLRKENGPGKRVL